MRRAACHCFAFQRVVVAFRGYGVFEGPSVTAEHDFYDRFLCGHG
jgi:hypothetical protein